MSAQQYDVVDRRRRSQRPGRRGLPRPRGAANPRARATPHRRRCRRHRDALRPRLQAHDASLRRVAGCRPRSCATSTSTRHGYHVYPQGPYFAPRADGRSLQLPDDRTARRREQISKFSAKDADAVDALGRVDGPARQGARPDGHRDPAQARLAQARPTSAVRPCCCAGSRTSTSARPSTSPDCSPTAPPTSSRTPSSPTRCAACSRVGGHRLVGRPPDSGHGVRHRAPPHRRPRRRPHRRLGLPARRHGRRDAGAGCGGALVRRRDPHRGAGRARSRQGRRRHRRRARRRHRDQRADRHHDHAPAGVVPEARRPRGAARGLRRGHRALPLPQRHGEDQRRARPAARVREPAGLRPAGARRHDRAVGEPRRGGAVVPGGGGAEGRARCPSPTSASPACSTRPSRPRAST